jgi:CRP/FNR family transcriptional regulator, cyclic AMP receptor protein
MLLHTSGWRVLESARVAVLDRLAATRLAGYPELTGSLVAKALERSRNLAVAMAIARHKRVEVRVHMLFWHLADRWGRVRLDGVVVPLRLSRWMLGDLVLAERESVSAALSSLARRGLLRYSGGEWLLWGDPPRELLQLEPNRFATNEAEGFQRALNAPKRQRPHRPAP